MPRFFFRLRENGQNIEDPIGLELDSLDAAEKEARRAILEILADTVRAGEQPDLGDGAIEILNEAKAQVLRVTFQSCLAASRMDGAAD